MSTPFHKTLQFWKSKESAPPPTPAQPKKGNLQPTRSSPGLDDSWVDLTTYTQRHVASGVVVGKTMQKVNGRWVEPDDNDMDYDMERAAVFVKARRASGKKVVAMILKDGKMREVKPEDGSVWFDEGVVLMEEV